MYLNENWFAGEVIFSKVEVQFLRIYTTHIAKRISKHLPL